MFRVPFQRFLEGLMIWKVCFRVLGLEGVRVLVRSLQALRVVNFLYKELGLMV